MSAPVYRRIQHAAHYEGGGGHDLEQWDCADFGRLRSGDPVRAQGVPSDATYHSGYRDEHGQQRWLFVRRAPMTGPACRYCRAALRGES